MHIWMPDEILFDIEESRRIVARAMPTWELSTYPVLIPGFGGEADAHEVWWPIRDINSEYPGFVTVTEEGLVVQFDFLPTADDFWTH